MFLSSDSAEKHRFNIHLHYLDFIFKKLFLVEFCKSQKQQSSFLIIFAWFNTNTSDVPVNTVATLRLATQFEFHWFGKYCLHNSSHVWVNKNRCSNKSQFVYMVLTQTNSQKQTFVLHIECGEFFMKPRKLWMSNLSNVLWFSVFLVVAIRFVW